MARTNSRTLPKLPSRTTSSVRSRKKRPPPIEPGTAGRREVQVEADQDKFKSANPTNHSARMNEMSTLFLPRCLLVST